MDKGSAVLAGLLLQRMQRAYLDELKAVRETLGEDWVGIRRNRNGKAERYYPVLDGLYKLTRELGECAAVLQGEERGEDTARSGWPGECSWPGMQEALGEVTMPVGEVSAKDMDFDEPGVEEVKPKGWSVLQRVLGFVNRKEI